jgi:hypothetical protein
MAENSYRVFISHGSPDRWIAKQIRKLLQTNSVSCFLDDADINIGDNFRTAILHELQVCNEVLVLLTPGSLNRAWVFAEIGAAILSEKRVVAIRYGVTMEELHDRGVVSLVGDVALTDLDHLDEYVAAVVLRSGT